MLLQGTAIVHFATAFLDEFKAKDIVLNAISIRDAGTATRHTLFQKEGTQDSQSVGCATYISKLAG